MAGANSVTIELLKKYNFPIQKKYGQNFLIDDNILDGIVRAAEISEGDTVLEIGPGLGALTAALCRSAGRVIAVEIDKMLMPILAESLHDYDNLTLVNQDIMKTDIRELVQNSEAKAGESAEGSEAKTSANDSTNAGSDPEQDMRIKVTANLPYYITTPIILELLRKSDMIQSITVMVQKEVAERMQEGPGSKSYGALSLAVQYYSKPNYIMTVSRNCFLPKPDVDSAVIRLDIYKPEELPVKPASPEQMFRIIRAAFNQRRKTLVNAMSNSPELSFSKEQITHVLEGMGKTATVRGEALTLEEFAQLSDTLG